MMISKKYTIEFAHRIDSDSGRERYPHGHTGKIVVKFVGEFVRESGRINDFNAWFQVEKIIDEMDYSLILCEDDKMLEVLLDKGIEVRIVKLPWSPTTEGIVKYLLEKIKIETDCLLQLFEISFEVSGRTITQNENVVRCKDEM